MNALFKTVKHYISQFSDSSIVYLPVGLVFTHTGATHTPPCTYTTRMRVIIAGSRSFTDYEVLEVACDNLLFKLDVECILSGTARGADRLGEQKDLRMTRDEERKLSR